MTASDTAATEKAGKPLRSALILCLVLAALGAGGGFYAVRAGMLPIPSAKPAAEGDAPAAESHAEEVPAHPSAAPSDQTEFVPIEPMVVSIGHGRDGRHLKFRAQLEVAPEDAKIFERVMPRILDMLNGYLRALRPQDLEDPLALLRIRAQLLQRVNLVSGGPKARNVLITEFVVN
ncbi:MAG TPA: flagellar basal body-associated FliL family protein [Thermopetrobacter sp.]|nr:flagellar basal body-associated FliL family protein [Thermopetrobacter sp.]